MKKFAFLITIITLAALHSNEANGLGCPTGKIECHHATGKAGTINNVSLCWNAKAFACQTCGASANDQCNATFPRECSVGNGILSCRGDVHF